MPLPELAQALLRPEAYPENPGRIELVQTQMSLVFLAGDYVYKIKKPVDLGYLDYTMLDKRQFYCQREVELNRRLCPETYLGVVPISQSSRGIAIGEDGETIEYAVKMRRLPREGMLDRLLANDRVSLPMMDRVARKITDFHAKTETSAAISAFGNMETIVQNIGENFRQTERYIGGTIYLRDYRRIRSYTRRFIRDNAALFQKRVTGGRIRDCHGDLHAAHICFTNGICIYDCIEFNDRFRYGDIASEVAFLAMDLDHYGRADLSRRFINAYREESRDEELIRLLNFYKCYRAYVRGKVESFKLDDPYISEAEKGKTADTAGSYFDLALAYTRARPLLIIMVGLVGTGKTSVARALASRLGAIVISSDVVRKELAGIPPTEHRFEESGTGIYSATFSRRTYENMYATAQKTLSEGNSVILDATFLQAEGRTRAREIAGETGAEFFAVECILDETAIRRRLAERLQQVTASDGRWEVYLAQKPRFQPLSEIPAARHVIIDNSQPLAVVTRQALEKINRRLD
ncbi:MAG: AAA family ATPase [Dehalococcoidales bacterium]|nr:AAA family ATPase [Dehalococcoidales bacterium]